MKNIPVFRSAMFLLSVAVLLVSGCHKQVAQAPRPATPAATAPPAAPTVTLQASPSSITRGASSMLSWSSSNATEIKLYPGGSKIAIQGSQSVTPSESTVYTISATGPGGTATAIASISVSVPVVPDRTASLTPEQMFRQSIIDAFFDYDKADIRADAKEVLTRDAEFLRTHPSIRFIIEGHCDERGGDEYNLALGDRRAEAAKSYLVSMGVSADRIQTESLGKEKPFCNSENESCYQQNRRGHFAIGQ